jgi:hypothetical protein
VVVGVLLLLEVAQVISKTNWKNLSRDLLWKSQRSQMTRGLQDLFFSAPKQCCTECQALSTLSLQTLTVTWVRHACLLLKRWLRSLHELRALWAQQAQL